MKFDSKYIATFSEPGWRQPEESGGSQKHQGVSPHAENASRAPMHHGVLPPLCRKCTVVVNNFDELCDPVAAKLEAFILIKKRNPH